MFVIFSLARIGLTLQIGTLCLSLWFHKDLIWYFETIFHWRSSSYKASVNISPVNIADVLICKNSPGGWWYIILLIFDAHLPLKVVLVSRLSTLQIVLARPGNCIKWFLHKRIQTNKQGNRGYYNHKSGIWNFNNL